MVMLRNITDPRGNHIDLIMYVDSDHAGDKSTCRLSTGILIYMNMYLIQWLSKKQPTIETSFFGAEFMAMNHRMETFWGLQYKLNMIEVPIYGPSYIYWDNISVIYNNQHPDSNMRGKSNSICYHEMRESVALGESLMTRIPTNYNPSDMMTRVVADQ